MTWALVASGTQAESAAQPVTMTFDCNGGEILILHLVEKDGASAGGSRGGGAPTYNGIAMTASPEGQVADGSEMTVEFWYLVNPASGSNTLSIPNTASGIYLVPICTAWTGVDTSDPLDTSESALSAGSANPSVTFTTGGSGKLIVDAMGSGYSSVPTANSHTLISSQDNGVETSNAQYTTDDGSGGITLSWTVASDDWAMIVCAFNEAGGAPPAARRIFVIG